MPSRASLYTANLSWNLSLSSQHTDHLVCCALSLASPSSDIPPHRSAISAGPRQSLSSLRACNHVGGGGVFLRQRPCCSVGHEAAEGRARRDDGRGGRGGGQRRRHVARSGGARGGGGGSGGGGGAAAANCAWPGHRARAQRRRHDGRGGRGAGQRRRRDHSHARRQPCSGRHPDLWSGCECGRVLGSGPAGVEQEVAAAPATTEASWTWLELTGEEKGKKKSASLVQEKERECGRFLGSGRGGSDGITPRAGLWAAAAADSLRQAHGGHG